MLFTRYSTSPKHTALRPLMGFDDCAAACCHVTAIGGLIWVNGHKFGILSQVVGQHQKGMGWGDSLRTHFLSQGRR
jgi:hypothetical protein